ncbi:MAG: DoxX family protein [Alphaproteobacteria bacterium]|nr:DoxX family protein [Alphaproteobacteria bacterium]
MQKILKFAAFKINLLEQYLLPLALLAVRIHLGLVFWRSGLTKLPWGSAIDLFKTEYIPNWEKNHVKDIFGLHIPFPVPSAEFGAYSATAIELACSVLLMLGLGGRFSAFMLGMMALSVELFVYPGESDHIHWMLLSAILVATGPGAVSIDYFIRRKLLKTRLYDRTVDIH